MLFGIAHVKGYCLQGPPVPCVMIVSASSTAFSISTVCQPRSEDNPNVRCSRTSDHPRKWSFRRTIDPQQQGRGVWNILVDLDPSQHGFRTRFAAQIWNQPCNFANNETLRCTDRNFQRCRTSEASTNVSIANWHGVRGPREEFLGRASVQRLEGLSELL